MSLHVDAAAAEGDSFGLQPETLFGGGLPAEFDLSSGSQHSLPR
jgi:hypothetical protein